MEEDFSSLVSRHDTWLKEVLDRHRSSFDSLLSSIDGITSKVSECETRNNEIVNQIAQLDALIEEERGKWKQRLDVEKNAMNERVSQMYTTNQP